jgi:nucleotide-binding universal stress UspA family protein
LALALPQKNTARIYPVHLIPLDDEYSFGSQPDQAAQKVTRDEQRLKNLVAQVEAPAGVIQPVSMISDDIPQDLLRIVQNLKANLILLGWHRPTFNQDILGGNVRRIMEAVPADVGVFIDRGFQLDQDIRITVPYSGTIHDRLALELALRLASGHQAHIEVLHSVLSRETQDLIALFREYVTIETTAVGEDPMEQIVNASRRSALVILGTSPQWGQERHVFGQITDDLVVRCPSSLIIVKHHKQATPHVTSLLPGKLVNRADSQIQPLTQE